MAKLPPVPEICDSQRTLLVVLLLEVIAAQRELIHQQQDIEALKEEVARFKKYKGKPKLRPSALEGKKSNRKRKKRHKGGGTPKPPPMSDFYP
ncbi:hypothetical protein [Nitrosococcus halophilus]|nr:hypothetical protein [Nitrosococcus halophilus]